MDNRLSFVCIALQILEELESIGIERALV